MTTNNESMLEKGIRKNGFGFTLEIENTEFEWNEQYITGEQAKKLGGLKSDSELMLSIKDPYDDEAIGDHDKVDLAREGIECFFVKKKLCLTLEGKEYGWHKQFITGFDLRKLGNLKDDQEIILLIQFPGEDELVFDESCIDLARPGIEHFSARKKGEGVLADIYINNKMYKIKRGKYSTNDIKKIASIPLVDELDQLINEILDPLDDQGILIIKGCEQFFSHKRGGSSS